MTVDWLSVTADSRAAAEVVRLVRRCVVPVGPLLGSLRTDEREKVRWVQAPNGVGTWLVTDYEVARGVLVDPRLSRAAAVGPGAPRLSPGQPAPDSIISLDGAGHARLRRLVTGAFTERRVADLLPFIDNLVADLLDGMAAQVAPADVVGALAAPLPLRVLCRVLGIPWQDQDQFASGISVLFEMLGDAEENKARAVRLARYMTALVARKRREGGDDLICALIKGQQGEDRLSNRELVTLALSLLMAGYETTVDQLSLCILSLLANAELAATLRADLSLIPAAVAEMMRISPAVSISFPRVASEPMTIGGQRVERGQPVVVSVIGANHGMRTDAASAAVSHLTFGHGIHRCIGAPLARVQLASALRGLLERFPRLALADDPAALEWKSGSSSRGLARLHVTW
jgi:cytochrome P450